eukprot:CAMPEP_0113655888 /NCGR_PEP_ID=MMETSP0017_2-20120614/29987_1 /TAXON_ID=2856 /ORGANISM="Cylindrotheca closterium" /LENGTH=30 /DNA_ID=CAMNT_0000569247 /DNA_START=114 /DNA_END=203 /DNA_ORIENTATION=+ /assembly_acc=CAM_ASM_000147
MEHGTLQRPTTTTSSVPSDSGMREHHDRNS